MPDKTVENSDKLSTTQTDNGTKKFTIDGTTIGSGTLTDADTFLLNDAETQQIYTVTASTLSTFIGGGTGTNALTSLDIDGAQAIGADLHKDDLIIVDDGANGTNRNATLERVKKFVAQPLNITTGSNNVSLGESAGVAITTGDSNTAIGFEALKTNIDGDYNTAIGYQALETFEANADGDGKNTAVGYNAGTAVSTGTGNTILGAEAGDALTTGLNNVLIGLGAGGASQAVDKTVVIGDGAGAANMTADADGTIAIGAGAGASITSGAQNTAIGFGSLDAQILGDNNTAVGYNALTANITGDGIGNNTAIGHTAGGAIIGGHSNTCIGASAGSSGSNDLTTGSNNTIIGYNAAASINSATNEITLGDSNIATIRCNTQVISGLSDARDKTNVVDSPYGLDFIDNIRPVQFTWQRRILQAGDENNSHNGKTRIGFLAQELQAAMPNNENDILNLVYESNPDRLEASYGNLLPIMVQAIKDLKAQNDALIARVTALENA
ncbi:Chaperone of endosialidase [seawater metagenome]|uniref:Chaperone of endosialidase n=1 Tax=seawater metagenome TaxID=1561972 RepID=A0A5E8CGJ3_9ZZZZ